MLNNEEPPLKLYLCLPSCSSYCYTSVSFVVHKKKVLNVYTSAYTLPCIYHNKWYQSDLLSNDDEEQKKTEERRRTLHLKEEDEVNKNLTQTRTWPQHPEQESKSESSTAKIFPMERDDAGRVDHHKTGRSHST